MFNYQLRCLCGLLVLAVSLQVADAAVVFSDNFNRTTGLGGAWATTKAGGDGGTGISSNQMRLTNDANGAILVNSNGRVYSKTPTSSFLPPYSATLNANPGIVTWSFNMQQVRIDPSGFDNPVATPPTDNGNYGVAFVLAGSDTNFALANGYAVVVGNANTDTDPLRLVRFTGGLFADGNLINIITSSGGGTADVGNNFLSVMVTYNPATDTWEMFSRNDGASFVDPLTGSLASVGTTVDSIYTGVVLSHLGTLWNYGLSSNQTALFDNFTVDVSTVPEPSSFTLISIGLLSMLHLRRRSF